MNTRRCHLSLARHPLALAALVAVVQPALAQAQAADAGGEKLSPKVVVTATRIEAPEDEVPATVTSKTAEEIERAQARDLKSMLDNEPGVAVRLQPARMSAVFLATGRGGNEGINIRGLEGNQVLLQVDGVRLPLAYDNGPFIGGRGDYIDVEAFKRVELLRGPSSASYGSDGLAGAVSFLTKDPADLLTLGKPWQGAIKLGYASADDSWVAVPSFAVRDGAWEAMLLASVRRGHELQTRGSVDSRNYYATVANPQDRRSDYVLGKAIYKLDASQQFKLTLEHLAREDDTNPIYTALGDPSGFINRNLTSASARTSVERSMGKLDWQYADARNPWVQRFGAWVYGQDSQNHQFGEELYNSPPASWARRTRDTTYGERSIGLGLQGESNLHQGVEQRVLWGLDYSDARITSLRDGASYSASGTQIASTAFPTQNFPNSDYRLLGAFVQDEIAYGAWRITPGLRFDRFQIAPDTGSTLFSQVNSVTPSELSGSAVSPRLGVVWQLAPAVQPYAQVAQGFRSPTPWQVNGGFSNQLTNPPYRSIGNPDLKPERATSFELGLRGRADALSWGAAIFKSRYRDFIVANADVSATTKVPLDPGMAANTITYQSINASRAEISGFELSGAWRFLPGWAAEARYAHARGDQWDEDGTQSPLQTIEPDKGTLAVRYERAKAWGGEFVLTGQRSQRRPYASGLYIPRGYITGDLSAWWDITPQWQLNLALNNLGDVKYVLWSDVRGVGASTAVADAYSQPGRNASVSVRYSF